MIKLLIPTQPVYETADSVNLIGKSTDVGALKGLFQSFSDAPGIPEGNGRNVFKEEMQEIMIATGIEYTFKNRYSLRAGYFYQNEDKGNLGFTSLGAGLDLEGNELSFAYIFPVEDHGLRNSWQFSLIVSLKNKQE